MLDSVSTQSSRLLIRTRDWLDRRTPTHSFLDQSDLEIGETTCFERMIIVSPSKQYFRDTTDADYFRKSVSQAHQSLL